MDYKRLFAKLQQNLDQIEQSETMLATLSAILERLVDDFRDPLGIVGGRIYVRRLDEFVLATEYPEPRARAGFRIPASYGPIQDLISDGFVLLSPDDPGYDHEIEQELGVGLFAAICLDNVPQRIMAFSLNDSSDRDHVIYSLNTIRHVINLKLRKEHLEDRLEQARSIQVSLLPSTAPRFADYDLWGRTSPAEEVGGDLFDFIPVSERSLGVAIADSAGHGLPAALQARDAIVGLRMGVEERWRITATVEKLNKVVGRSATASRFISLFYCEVEPGGTLAYCNAGHNPPLLLSDGEFRELTEGGLILGPNPDALYERGYAEMSPGSILLAYTDGITEAENAEDEMFGTERLKQIVRSQPWESSRSLVDAVFDEVRRFSPVDPPVDDQTVLAVMRPRVGE